MNNDTKTPTPGWSEASLGEFCLFVQGQSPPGETYNTKGEGLPFFQGKAEFGEMYPTPTKWCSAPTKIAQPDDILISIRAPVGPTNLCATTACIGRGLAAIRPQGGSLSKYVLYGLRLTAQNLAALSTGSTFSAISGEVLRRHPLPVAPIAEQHRIVEEIEKQFTRLEAGVVALKRVQANLKRYRAAVLKAAVEGHLVPTEAELARREGRPHEPASELLARLVTQPLLAVSKKAQAGVPVPLTAKHIEAASPDSTGLPSLPEGWTCAPLRLIADLKGGITKGQKRKPTDQLRSVPYLRVANVQRGYLDLEEVKTIEASEDEIADLELLPGDVLFNEGGDRDKLGRGWVWDGQIKDCIHQNHVFRARLLSKGILPKFLSWYGNSIGQRYFNDEGKQTTNLASLNMTKLGRLPVPIPPAAEQKRIVAEVDRRLSVIDELEMQVEANLKRAERLRQAILKRAFEGKLVPQDPNDEPASMLLERIKATRRGRL